MDVKPPCRDNPAFHRCSLFPMQNLFRKSFSQVQQNWQSGVTVALVSVPLSLSLAIASGAPPITGIITAVWAGLISAFFCASDYNVIGPAGALSGILMAFTQQFGAEALPALAVVSGLGILLFWLLKWDRYLVFIPGSVMHGFTLGVALTIGLGQLNFALGLRNMPSHPHFLENFWETILHLPAAHFPSVIATAATIGILWLFIRFAPRVPGAIVAAGIGIVIGKMASMGLLDLGLLSIQQKFGELHGNIILVPAFSLDWLNTAFFHTAATVTIVAVLETLLSGKIAGMMTKTKFSEGREVFGLGLANIASGFLGGLPATGVLARTALNVKTGAKSRVSSGINALVVAVLSLLFFGWFQYMPLPVVAGILIVAAIRMVETEHFVTLFRFNIYDFFLAMTVGVLTAAVDALVGLSVGAIVSLLIAVRRLSHGQCEITLHQGARMVARVGKEMIMDTETADTAVYRFAGELNYFNSLAHAESVGRLQSPRIILSLRNLFDIDLDGLHALEEIIGNLEKSQKSIWISGATGQVKKVLAKTSWYSRMEGENRIFESTTEALNHVK